MRMGLGVRTGLRHGGITCVLQTQFSSFFLFLNENIHCDTSLELSLRDIYGEIWLVIPKLSLLPVLIWSTVSIVICI